jgi:phage protein D
MGTVQDHAPTFSVKITPSQADGGGTFDVSENILSMTYDDKEAQLDKLCLDVNNFDLSNFDAPIWKTGNKLEVSWGYDGNMSPPRTLRIQKVTGGTQLKVEALDEGCLMNRNHVVKTWENMKRSDVVKAIAEANGYTGDRVFIDDTSEVLTQITQARMTDAQFCRDMAKREGFEFYIDFDGFHWHARKLGQKPLRTFTYYVDQGAGDIISFSVENDLYARKAGGMQAQGIDPKTKALIDVKADNSTSTGQTSLAPEKIIITGISDRDGSTTGDSVKESGSSVINRTTEKTADSATRHTQGAFNKSQLNAAILTVEARGDPSMIAKIVVTINGIGKTLSGNYYVTEVNHKIGQGYTMQFKCRRDGRSAPNNAAAYGEAAGKGGAGSGVGSKGAQNNATGGTTPPGGTGPQDDLLPVSGKDGSVSFSETRGRTQQGAPAPPGDPLGIVHHGNEDNQPDGKK